MTVAVIGLRASVAVEYCKSRLNWFKKSRKPRVLHSSVSTYTGLRIVFKVASSLHILLGAILIDLDLGRVPICKNQILQNRLLEIHGGAEALIVGSRLWFQAYHVE